MTSRRSFLARTLAACVGFVMPWRRAEASLPLSIEECDGIVLTSAYAKKKYAELMVDYSKLYLMNTDTIIRIYGPDGAVVSEERLPSWPRLSAPSPPPGAS